MASCLRSAGLYPHDLGLVTLSLCCNSKPNQNAVKLNNTMMLAEVFEKSLHISSSYPTIIDLKKAKDPNWGSPSLTPFQTLTGFLSLATPNSLTC